MKALLSERNARFYLAGQTLSLLGDSSLWLALAIWVKELTHSSGEAGLTFFFFGLSGLFSPFAGLVVDRVRRRPLLIVANLASAAGVLGLFLVHGRGQVFVIYLVMFGYGISYCFLGSGQSALLQAMLPAEMLADANSFLQTVREGLRLVTPLIGAGLFALVGGHVIAVVDAVTFLAAALSLLPVHFDENAGRERREAKQGLAAWWEEVTAGARHLWRTIVLRQLVIGAGIALLVIGFLESIDFAVVSLGLHRAPTFLGVLLAVQGAGAIVGGTTASRLMRRVGGGVMTGIGLGLLACGTILLASSALAVVVTGVVLFGLSIPWIIVGVFTLLQLRTPTALQGRVYSAADTVLSVPQTISIGVGAVLVGIVDYRLLLAVVAAVLAVSATYLLTRPEQRVKGVEVEAPSVEATATCEAAGEA